jgi:hypothetical protein
MQTAIEMGCRTPRALEVTADLSRLRGTRVESGSRRDHQTNNDQNPRMEVLPK